MGDRERRGRKMGGEEEKPGRWATFTADMQRYVGTELKPWSFEFLKQLAHAAYVHPGLLAIVVYRYGQWVEYRCRTPLIRQLCNLHYFFCFNWARTRLQIEIPRRTQIGPGLRIDHFGSIIVNSQITAGKNLTLSHGVLIGQNDTGYPTLLDDIYLGVGARVIGKITLGNHMRVGAGAVVTKSFPDYAIVAGVPAKLLRIQEPTPPQSGQEVAVAEQVVIVPVRNVEESATVSEVGRGTSGG